MPLHILGVLVVVGLIGLAVLMHTMGLTTRRKLSNTEDARAAWQREFPRIPPGSVLLCRNGTSALLETAQGPGVVWAMGEDTTARFLTGGQLQQQGRKLILRLPDFSAPRITLHLSDDEIDTHRHWLEEHLI